LLDIDGTLLDSHPAHTHAWQRTLAAHGILKKIEEIQYEFSDTDPDVARTLFYTSDEELVAQISREKNNFFLEEIPRIPLFPYVSEILTRIHADQIPVCFVSANYNRILQRMMETYDWTRVSAGFVGIDGVTRSKPDPEMLLLGLNKIRRKPHECVMIGDSPADILAGKSAGTHTIALCSSGHSSESFAPLKPDKILRVIGDLLPLLPLVLD